MGILRNIRKKNKEVPKEEQNYTVIVGGIPKVIPWKEYKENYLDIKIPEKPEEVLQPTEEITNGV